jgi:uncharacterized protein (TIGR00290 family)
MMNAVMNWSGGKDSTLALYRCLQQSDCTVQTLFTTLSNSLRRITMHGVREELLEQQAQAIGIPLVKMELPSSNTMEAYQKLMSTHLNDFKQQGINTAIFGDIYLEDLKAYREKQLEHFDLKGYFPLWKEPVKTILQEFIDLGFKAVVVCCNARLLDKSFLGRIIDEQFIKDLPSNVDPCGENGEFHTFVVDGPIFKQSVNYKLGEKVYKTYPPSKATPELETGFHFIELRPANN